MSENQPSTGSKDIPSPTAPDLSREQLQEIAEFATATLHNVGNLLNSLMISCQQMRGALQQTSLEQLAKANDLIEHHQDELGAFFGENPKGKLLPRYLRTVETALRDEQNDTVLELDETFKKLRLMDSLIQTQHTTTKGETIYEIVNLKQMVEETLIIKNAALSRQHIEVEPRIEEGLLTRAMKARLSHLMINLVKNAIEAMEKQPEPRVLKIDGVREGERIRLSFCDNGYGIKPDVLPRLFTHGYTTKRDGHGFGLYYCARTMHDMDGQINATSDGENQGACFNLWFPSYESMRDS